jgi:hypothetical protein
MIPPAATAATTAFDVQLAGVPEPITWVGREVSTALASAGTLASPAGLPAPACGRGGQVAVAESDGGAPPIPCRAAGPAAATGALAVAAGGDVLAAGLGVEPQPASTADRAAARTAAREATRTWRV